MIANQDELHVTLEQLDLMIQALENLRQDLLPKNPELFGVLAESCLEDVGRLRDEIRQYLHEVRRPAG